MERGFNWVGDESSSEEPNRPPWKGTVRQSENTRTPSRPGPLPYHTVNHSAPTSVPTATQVLFRATSSPSRSAVALRGNGLQGSFRCKCVRGGGRGVGAGSRSCDSRLRPRWSWQPGSPGAWGHGPVRRFQASAAFAPERRARGLQDSDKPSSLFPGNDRLGLKP